MDRKGFYRESLLDLKGTLQGAQQFVREGVEQGARRLKAYERLPKLAQAAQVEGMRKLAQRAGRLGIQVSHWSLVENTDKAIKLMRVVSARSCIAEIARPAVRILLSGIEDRTIHPPVILWQRLKSADCTEKIGGLWLSVVVPTLKEEFPQCFTDIEDDGWAAVCESAVALKLLADLINHDPVPIGPPVWPPDDGWHFESGRYAFRRRQGELKGLPWKLLRCLSKNRRPATTSDLIRDVWDGEEKDHNTIRGTLSKARASLRETFELSKSVDPIPFQDRGDQAAWLIDESVLTSSDRT